MSPSSLVKSSTAATLALATSLLSFTGCANKGQESASGGPDVYRSDSQTARLDSKSVDGPAPTNLKTNAYQPSSTAMAFPTGDRNTSAVLVEKNAPKQVRINAPYTYQLKVTNLTDQNLNNVAVREQLPENFRITNVANATTQPAGGATADANTPRGMNVYTLGELKPRESRTIEVTGTPTAAGDLASCTTLTYQPTLCSVAQVVAPAIRLAKTGPQQADICEEVVWQYSVANEGTGVAPNVVVNDKLPQGLQTIDGKDNVQINVGDLEQGKNKEYRVRLKANQTGQFASA
ncbi:MAG TPA: hypothetical protein VK324_18270, partial [Tepidisphaeraceae bacterium]|nr:hypothetical protein [Tepidisphaeraceae bacterium]